MVGKAGRGSLDVFPAAGGYGRIGDEIVEPGAEGLRRSWGRMQRCGTGFKCDQSQSSVGINKLRPDAR